MLKQYTSEILGLILAFLVLNLWYMTSIAIEEKIIPVFYDHILRGITVLIGAAAGAALAYKFNIKLEENKSINEQYITLNSSLVSIAIQLNVLDNIEGLFDEKSPFEKAFSRAERNYNPDIYCDVGKLIPILIKKPQIILEIRNAQDCFIQTINSHEIRNQAYINKIYPELKKLSDEGVKSTENNLKEHLANETVKIAYESIKALEQSLDGSKIELKKSFCSIRNEAIKLHDGKDFLDLS